MNFYLKIKKWALACFMLLCAHVSWADDYENAWEAIRQNNLGKAKELLKKAIKDPKRTIEATISLIYLANLGHQDDVKEAQEFFYELFAKGSPAYPELYATWFNAASLGGYKKKNAAQLKLLEKLLKDPNMNGSLKAALNYQKKIHFEYANAFEEGAKLNKNMGAIAKWQFAGAFDNLMGSGFDKNYAPIQQAQLNEKQPFMSANNAEINWTNPPFQNPDGWMHLNNYVYDKTAIVYAQSFVSVEEDTEAILALGVNGTIKAWVNDQLLISEQEDRRTELDAYKVKCKLKKGFNRILIQIGYINDYGAYFMARLIDKQYNPIILKSVSDTYQPYTKDVSNDKPEIIMHFAEEYFLKKTQENPANPIYKLLLANAYLRNGKEREARTLIKDAYDKDANNIILNAEFLNIILQSGNRTEALKEINAFREKYPESALAMLLRQDELTKEEKYEDSEKILEEYISKYGENEETWAKKLRLFVALRKQQDLISTVDMLYQKYPENSDFVYIYYNVQKEMTKDSKKSLKTLEKFYSTNYNGKIFDAITESYIELGMAEKAVAMIEKMRKNAPYEEKYLEMLYGYHFSMKKYDKALEYANIIKAQVPYSSKNWRIIGTIYENQGKEDEALACYTKAIYYNPNDYTTRRKLRKLSKKTDILTTLPQEPIYDLIRKNANNTSDKHDWYYILDEKQKIVYEESASEEFFNVAVKILNQKGVDYWHRIDIPYNEYRERLVVEKVEIIKKNGNKIQAEARDNTMVFAGLEIGDAIYMRYKIETYNRGRLANDFWDTYTFNSTIPSNHVRYTLVLPAKKEFKYVVNNATLEPSVKEFEDFKIYTWEMKNTEAIKMEPYMPAENDISIILNISTLKSWQDIVNWYSDISSPQAKYDFEVQKVFEELFPQGTKGMKELDVAQKIYAYIVKNLQYSSISFRQSAYTPQKAARTLHTKLGDCKDFSTLFATLARQAGLQTNLVLVDSRNNGKKSLPLPLVGFNHCIVKVMIDKKDYYLELTDSKLPFASLPETVEESNILEIPYNNKDTQTKGLETLKSNVQTIPNLFRTIKVRVDKKDMHVEVNNMRTGPLTSYIRHKYSDLSEEKQKEEILKSIASDFTKPVTLNSWNYKNLDVLSDTLHYMSNYTVKGEIMEVGSLKTLKVPFVTRMGRVDNFTEETRKYNIPYWKVENTDLDVETVIIEIPTGTQFVDIPKNVTYQCDVFSAEYTYTKQADNKLLVVRRVKSQRNQDITPEKYPDFKKTITQLADEEGRFITFK